MSRGFVKSFIVTLFFARATTKKNAGSYGIFVLFLMAR